jgi:hypothetical protein
VHVDLDADEEVFSHLQDGNVLHLGLALLDGEIEPAQRHRERVREGRLGDDRAEIDAEMDDGLRDLRPDAVCRSTQFSRRGPSCAVISALSIRGIIAYAPCCL